MVLGPLEYLVVGFENYRFTGQILAELRAAPGGTTCRTGTRHHTCG